MILYRMQALRSIEFRNLFVIDTKSIQEYTKIYVRNLEEGAFMTKVAAFIKRNPVVTVAGVAALITMFLVPPSRM